jgi:hypothetical protein
VYNVGLSAEHGRLTLYDYAANTGSSHSSLYAEAIQDIHAGGKAAGTVVSVVTLDEFCKQHSVEVIDLLKIDTEGHDLKVLQGASRLLAEGRITLIQFEFNEMNVYSRVFLRDFYEMLHGFSLFRLAQNGLISLGNYNAQYEIFKFQNILAIRNQKV